MSKLSQKILLLFILISNLKCNTEAMNVGVNWDIINSIRVNDQNIVYLTVDKYNRLKEKNIQMYRSLDNFLISNDFVYIGVNGATVEGYYSHIRKNEKNDCNKVIVPQTLENKIPIHPIILYMQNLKDEGITLCKDDRFDGEDVSYKIYNENKDILYYNFNNKECGFEKFDFNDSPKFPLQNERIYIFPNSLLPDYIQSSNKSEENETNERIYMFPNSLLPNHIQSSNKPEENEAIVASQGNSSYSSLFPHGLTY